MTDLVDDPITDEDDAVTGADRIEEDDVIEDADGALDDEQDLRDEVDVT